MAPDQILHYRIEQKLGEGGMGEVYLATDTMLGRKVALKFLPESISTDPVARARLIREAKAASLLNHPNILTVHAVEEADDRHFIVMEYVDGRSLGELLKDGHRSLDETVQLAIQMGEGLNEAHDAGIVHRDLKPANIMIDSKGRARILDFGVAKLTDASKLTKSGSTIGTIAYSSPEQVENRDVDHRSDIFSFAVMLYEMIAGERPFEGHHEAAIVYSIAHEEPKALAEHDPTISEDMQRLVSKGLAKDPADRYQSIADLVSDLRKVQTGEHVEGGVQPGRVRKRRRIAGPLALAGAIALAAYLVLGPLRVRMGSDSEAVASEHMLAVMYFDNLVDSEDEDRTSDILTSLLITNLSESASLSVVSRQRLWDILRQLGHTGSRSFDQSAAAQVAETARVKYLVTGEIVQQEPALVVTANVSEVETGVNVSSHRMTAVSGQDVFSLVDHLSSAIRKDLSVPGETEFEPVPKTTDVTTSSSEAYRHYLEGLDFARAYQTKKAVETLQKALEHDSTFVMAHLLLFFLSDGSVYLPLEEGVAHWEQAKRNADRATWKEQLRIEAVEAGMARDTETQLAKMWSIIERDPTDKEAYVDYARIRWSQSTTPEELKQVALLFERVIELDPYYKTAYNNLAYVYRSLDDMPKAHWAIDQYISLAPDEPNAVDTRGDFYQRDGRFRDAISSWRKALEMDPDFGSEGKIARTLTVNLHDYESAAREYQKMASHSEQGTRSMGRLLMTIVPLYRGQFSRALEILDQGLAADRIDGASELFLFWKHFAKMRILVELKRWDEAFVEFEPFWDLVAIGQENVPNAKEGWRFWDVDLRARSGDLAGADSLLDLLRNLDTTTGSRGLKETYWVSAATVAEVREDWPKALAHWDSAYAWVSRPFGVEAAYIRGRALYHNGELGEAAEEFNKAIKKNSGATFSHYFWKSKAHYYLGVIYQKSGWDPQAIEQLETFLEIWAEADPGQDIVVDARRRLDELRS